MLQESKLLILISRSSGIRTHDPLLPKQMLYQTELHSEKLQRQYPDDF